MKKKYLIFSAVLAAGLFVGQLSAGNFYSKPQQVESHQEKKVYRLNIQKEYLDYIIEGKKISEGRVNIPDYANVKPGDILLFWDNEGGSAYCSVTSVGRYDSFQKMLVSNGVVSMLPDINPDLYTADQMVDLGVQVYDSFPGYKVGVKIYGSIAFGLMYEGDEL